MDRDNRPLSREKKVVSGSAHVGRRQSAAGGGHTGGSGGGGNPLITLVVIGLLAIFGGGGLFTGLLGNPGTAPQTSAQNVQQQPQSGQSQFSSGGGLGGKLDTTVSKDARNKRVVLKGDGKDTTTILVYMCGTDLESGGGYATKDLQEMAAAKLGEQVELLVFTGGCKGWKNSVVSSQKNQIYRVQDGGLALLWESKKLQPMTEPGTLAEFIQWGKKNAPADRYELIFWDHGGGSVSGYGYDEVYPRSGSMTLSGIADALKKGGVTFDFIGFDACLMATLETALVAEPYADYLIASEETEPGCGWYYTDWLNALGKEPSLSALEMGRMIADDFVSVCGKVASRQQATLSVIDLAELAGTVPEPFKDFAQATVSAIRSDDYRLVASARGETKEFARSSNIDQVDLIHLADNLNTPESEALAKALRGAVKYNATSHNISNANGVSIYFPYGRTGNVNKMAAIYDDIGMDDAYTQCIKSFASLEVAGQSVAGGSAGQLDSLFGALTGGGNATTGSFGQMDASAVASLIGALLSDRAVPDNAFLDRGLLERSAGYLAEHRFDPSGLKWTKKDGQKVLKLGEEQWSLVQDMELNVFVDDGDGFIDLGLDNVLSFNDDGDLIGDYDRTWLSVDGHIVAYYMLSSEGTSGDYKIMGRIPALLNGQRVELIACFTDEVPDGEILGAAVVYDEDTQTSTIARGLQELQQGDVIDFLCQFYDYDRNYQAEYYLGDPLTVKGVPVLGNIRMDNTKYIAAYRVTDIYNNHYWTPSV